MRTRRPPPAAALAALALACVAPPGARAAEPSSEHGRQVFQACAACHGLEPGAQTLGPSLRGVVGRRAGGLPGFNYSRAMRQSGLTWTPAVLDRYIADPQAVVPGNHMPYSGLPDAADRADLLAYLQTLK